MALNTSATSLISVGEGVSGVILRSGPGVIQSFFKSQDLQHLSYWLVKEFLA